jgi:hypothetical protein
MPNAKNQIVLSVPKVMAGKDEPSNLRALLRSLQTAPGPLDAEPSGKWQGARLAHPGGEALIRVAKL